MPDPTRVYWDSCVTLSYLQEHPIERVPILQLIVTSAYDKRVHLYTSTIAIVEVAYSEEDKTGKTLDPSIEAKIERLWADRAVITLVEFHELIARDARTLLRAAAAAGRSGLKPMDAIHLATAQRLNIAEFHTYDERLRNVARAVALPFPVIEPRTDQPLLFT